MKRSRVAGIAILMLVGTAGSAHRLDEYLQATTISVEKDRVQAQIRLTPGVAVFAIVLAGIDTDADGFITEAEQQAYARRVLRDLSLTIDGERARLRLMSTKSPKTEEMMEGRGEIQIEFDADVPFGGPNRTLIFENHHQNRIAAYLVNCLVPRDPDIRVIGQNRNYEQSLYRLDYEQAGVRSGLLSFAWWSGGRGWLAIVALLLFARLAWVLRQRVEVREL